MEAGTGIICPRCATENPANAKFCQRCWAFLRGRHCPHCGKQATRAGARYCEHCNRDLDAEPTTPLPRVDDDPAGARVRSVPWLQPPDPVDEPSSLDEPPMAHMGATMTVPVTEVREAIDHVPVAPVLESTADDQPVPIPIELPEAPGHPFLPPPPSRVVVQPSPQPAAPVTQSPVDTPAPAPQQWQEPKRPKKPPRSERRSGSPAVTVAVVLIVFAVIGAMLALRKQRTEVAAQAGVSPTQRAASPAQPAAAPSLLPASPAGAPTQAASVGGTVKITTTPAGAQVEFDWVQVGVTTTALTLADVRPGKHTIKVSKPGFQSQIRDVQVIAGELIVLELTLPGSPSPSGPRRRPAAPPPLPPPP